MDCFRIFSLALLASVGNCLMPNGSYTPIMTSKIVTSEVNKEKSPSNATTPIMYVRINQQQWQEFEQNISDMKRDIAEIAEQKKRIKNVQFFCQPVGNCLVPNGSYTPITTSNVTSEANKEKSPSNATTPIMYVWMKQQEWQEGKQYVSNMRKNVSNMKRGIAEIAEQKKMIAEQKKIIKELKCKSWLVDFKTAANEIKENACKLLTPSGKKDRRTIPVPQLILTTAIGIDQNFNMMRWFKDMRRYIIRSRIKENVAPIEYIKESLDDLSNAIQLAMDCEDKTLYQYIPEDKLNDIFAQIGKFRHIYEANGKRKVPRRVLNHLLSILKNIIGILFDGVR